MAYHSKILSPVKRRRAGLQAALYHARQNRIARADGGGTPMPPVPTSTWNPLDKNAGITLSGDDLIASGSSGNNGVRGTLSHATGKWYLEFKDVSFGGAGVGEIGFANSLFDLNSNSADHSIAVFQYGGNTPSGSGMGSAPDGHITGAAIDIDAGNVWFRYDTGNWNNDPTADPVTGVKPFTFSGFGVLFPLVLLQNGGHVTLVTGDFAHAPPTGYLGWG